MKIIEMQDDNKTISIKTSISKDKVKIRSHIDIQTTLQQPWITVPCGIAAVELQNLGEASSGEKKDQPVEGCSQRLKSNIPIQRMETQFQ
ncbi:MAG: hypothetical protein EZS28_020557 [Streblomastix strix]|uniref:Uncharacterized protein n=1 Tax=Streblomastix strix TaxID=222440 RepID=A0A5J4VMT5_9EUKA|nr:MAG: hypothetical protein EZS28_020557 [Streblomastix strix]